MASSKVMASSTSSTNNSDLPRKTTSTYSSIDLTNDTKNYGSMSMDELIRNIYGENPPPPSTPPPPDIVIDGVLESQLQQTGTKTAEEVWKEISGGGNNNNNEDGIEEEEEEEEEDRKVRGDPGEMTLEEFLTKAGAVREEDMKIPQMVGPVHGFVVDPVLDSTRYAAAQQGGGGGGGGEGGGSGSGSILWLGNGGDRAGGGRGKRRAVLEPIDKVAQQRQRRMIKNRESAARSRERKQAYTVELESLVTQLEEENARLQKEQVKLVLDFFYYGSCSLNQLLCFISYELGFSV
ncbi:hypothetical protein IFM89_020525 [Coptis chinensis]|uniref:BZIP domain-containing protein n=1 Tax=Coptis chinensis TaxID=261450 RepID=A0A835HNH8_9MAGN|nr:hypothetical protein IFM89_020525 [Coptis chinensis]